MIQKKGDKPVTFYREKVFPALAACLWLGFLFLDLSGLGDSTWLKFTAISLCALTAWTGTWTADGKIVAAALAFTLAADVFLLLLNRDGTDQAVGVALFIVVQALYAHRLRLLRGGFISKFALFRVLGLVAAAVVAGKRDLPSALAVFYFCSLLVNLQGSFAYAHSAGIDREPLGRRFGWGLFLLACCDVCVGLWNLGGLPPQWLTEFARVGMWLFYVPSQVLIVLSQDVKGDAP